MSVIDERTLREFWQRGERILFLKGSRLTPAAQDFARQHQLQIIEEEADYTPISMPVHALAVGCDHGGYELKQYLVDRLQQAGYAVQDVGTHSSEPVDYPDFALEVARRIAGNKVDRGIMVDSIGLASAMVMNKLRGVRAAPCWNPDTARSARSHNDANALTLGGKILEPSLAWDIVQVFLREPFSGGRHERRVRKIEAVGKL